jgi:hypothetical protein
VEQRRVLQNVFDAAHNRRRYFRPSLNTIETAPRSAAANQIRRNATVCTFYVIHRKPIILADYLIEKRYNNFLFDYVEYPTKQKSGESFAFASDFIGLSMRFDTWNFSVLLRCTHIFTKYITKNVSMLHLSTGVAPQKGLLLRSERGVPKNVTEWGC